MRGDSESRSRYLSLALTSRGAINGLREVASGHPVNTKLADFLKRLLAGVDQKCGDAFVSHLQGSGTWTHFEELSTVDEVEKETGTQDLAEVVSAVLGQPNDLSRENAKRLISFLTAVEGRALQRYTESTELRIA
ncbi:MAG: hypothetical protein ACLPLR_13085 [Terriglobales bacterium]